jgi:hypothetical protein
MFHLNPTRSERARQARIRQEARYLKYWILKVRAAGLILALAMFAAPDDARADAATGLADDPKDMSSSSTTTEVMTMSSPFLPLPGWSKFEKMPPLPDQLTPLGKKTVAPAAVTPVIARKDPGESTPAVFVPKPKDVPVVNNNPTLMAVSPFLQWIQAHPKDAGAQARKQAEVYNAAPPAAASGTAPAAAAGSDSPYWMPPLIDSGDTAPLGGSSSTTTGSGGSAAIYSTPQRN